MNPLKHLKLEIHHDIALLIFDRVAASVNVFDKEVLTELDEALSLIENNHIITGLVIQSAKPNIFIAGADIKTLSSASTAEVKSLIHLGQDVFDRLENLKIPTVAAINGACVGGGFEMALACDWRITSSEKHTQVGLPETLLGLIPAWGGCTRLPILVGLPNALSLILAGKLLKPKAAKHKGIIDLVVAKELLTKEAVKLLRRGKRKHSLHLKFHNPISVGIIKNKASKNLYNKTRDLYPAPLAALNVMCKGILASHSGSLHYESEAFSKLIELPQTKQMLRLFFLTEAQKKLPIAKSAKKTIHQTVVIGAGVMGAGIAYWLSSKKKEVILKDINHQAVSKGLNSIQKLADSAVKNRVMEKIEAQHLLDRIYGSHESDSFYQADIVIEAAVEKMDIKKSIFSELARLTEPDCILATNTSALPISELAEFNANPERVIGLHFFNPVPRMKLVEVVKTKYTSDQVLADAVKFVLSIGKLPVVVNDSPGFLVNRILMPYLILATELFANGNYAHDIDDQMLDFGMPMGPLRLLDEVGLDVALHVADTLSSSFPDRMRVPGILKQLIDKGHLGRKTGQGFYNHTSRSTPLPVNLDAVTLQERKLPSCQSIATKLAHVMSDEAHKCLEEGIVSSAEEIDFAMVMGTGYAPFRGGPMEYAKSPDYHPNLH